jgi:hypothetical protein
MTGTRMIQVRKLAAVDMVWLSTRVVLIEYALGVLLPLALGLASLGAGLTRSLELWNWQLIFGVWLVTIAANYVPLFLYALAIARAGTVKQEGEPELANARRYGIQQAIILVPFLVVALALAQERGRRKPEETK